jgi:hypothetical protein
MPTRLAKLLITTTAIAILALPACADPTTSAASSGSPGHPFPPSVPLVDPPGSTILNGQVTFGAQWSTINTTVKNVNGDVVIQGQGAGNVLEAVTFDDTHVTSTQDAQSTNIGSTINAKVDGVGGSVSISGLAVCNSTDISTDPNVTAVNSKQTCNAQDPGSEINGTVRNVTGDVAVQSTAYGNTYTEDTNATNAPTHIQQTNTSSVFGTTNMKIQNVGGSVAVTASAVGNNAQVVHYSTNGASSTGNSGQ